MGRVILIDDEVRLLRTLKRLLEGLGHEVVAGTRFSEVQHELRLGNFDVLISDILLPGQSGIEILEEVGERGCQEPVILMTGEPNVETASEAVRLGAYDYLSKPVTKVQLGETVARALRHVELLRERDRAQASERRLLENLAEIGQSAAMLAHEIKSPISNVNLALRAVADQLGEDQQKILGELSERMKRLERIMMRTLQFVKPLDQELHGCDLVPVLRSVRAQFEEVEKTVELEITGFPEHVELQGDSQLLDQLLTNLAKNAARAVRSRLLEEAVDRGDGRLDPEVEDAANEGGVREGKVRISGRPEGEDAWVVDVEDSGPGIPRKDWDSVFKPFFSKSSDGTGLGLAICRKIVDTHRGSISVHDSDLGGACFRIRLPAWTGSMR